MEDASEAAQAVVEGRPFLIGEREMLCCASVQNGVREARSHRGRRNGQSFAETCRHAGSAEELAALIPCCPPVRRGGGRGVFELGVNKAGICSTHSNSASVPGPQHGANSAQPAGSIANKNPSGAAGGASAVIVGGNTTISTSGNNTTASAQTPNVGLVAPGAGRVVAGTGAAMGSKPRSFSVV
jgi:hypothetical protein